MAHLATGASAMPRSQCAPYFTGRMDDRLHDFMQKALQVHMCSKDDVLEYYHGFDLLCKPLTDTGHITTED